MNNLNNNLLSIVERNRELEERNRQFETRNQQLEGTQRELIKTNIQLIETIENYKNSLLTTMLQELYRFND